MPVSIKGHPTKRRLPDCINTLPFGPGKSPGQPTKYKGQATLDLVFGLALLGASEEEMIRVLDIHTDTFYEWKKHIPEFAEAIENGKERADAEVANSLYKRAKGYTYSEEVTVFKNGKHEIETIQRTVQPDVTAAKTWLAIRRRKVDKQSLRWVEQQEVVGPDGTPLVPPPTIAPNGKRLQDMTVEELEALNLLAGLADPLDDVPPDAGP